jgi:hypothetical protein
MRSTIEQWLMYNNSLESFLWIISAGTVIVFVLFGRKVPLSRLIPTENSRAFWLILLPIAAAARAPLMFQPMWYDETFTHRMAAIPLQNFFTALMSDVHPPGHYLIVRGAALFGASPLALRLPSLLAGVLLIWLVYRVALLFHKDMRSAQFAALITAFLPAMSYYSTEARYPVFLACLALLSIISLKTRKPLLFALTTGAMAWIHASGMIYAALLIPFALAGLKRKWLISGAGAAAIAGLWIPGMVIQSRDIIDGFWLLNRLPIWHVIDMTMREAAPGLPFAAFTWSTPLLLSLVGGWFARKWINPLWIAVAIGVPLLLWSIGEVWSPVYLTRALIAPALLLVICWSYFLIRSQGKLRVVLALMLMVSLTLSNTWLYAKDRTQIDDVFASCAGADYIYTTSTNMTIMAMSYSTIPVVSWQDGNNLHQELTVEARRAMAFDFRPVESLSGDVCMVSQLSYFTSDQENDLIQRIHLQSRSMMEVEQNDLYRYAVLRFNADNLNWSIVSE